MNHVKADPYRVPFRAGEFVPIAFVYADHFSGMTGDAAVAKEIRRVCEDEVDGFCGEGGEDFEAVCVVEAEVVFVVAEGFGLGEDCGVGSGES